MDENNINNHKVPIISYLRKYCQIRYIIIAIGMSSALLTIDMLGQYCVISCKPNIYKTIIIIHDVMLIIFPNSLDLILYPLFNGHLARFIVILIGWLIMVSIIARIRKPNAIILSITYVLISVLIYLILSGIFLRYFFMIKY